MSKQSVTVRLEHLREFLETVKICAQKLLGNAVRIKPLRDPVVGVIDYYELVEVIPYRIFGFIPWRKKRPLFQIATRFRNEGMGRKEIVSTVKAEELRPMIKGEIGRYARAVGATHIRLDYDIGDWCIEFGQLTRGTWGSSEANEELGAVEVK